MKKKEINAIIKEYRYRMIPHSWYATNECTLFNASDECGMCHQFFIDWTRRRAKRKMLSADTILKDNDVAFMFFEEV